MGDEERENGRKKKKRQKHALTRGEKKSQNLHNKKQPSPHTKSLDAPAAAHPVETYGEADLSLAEARRAISRSLGEAKQALKAGCTGDALARTAEALSLARELRDAIAAKALELGDNGIERLFRCWDTLRWRRLHGRAQSAHNQ